MPGKVNASMSAQFNIVLKDFNLLFSMDGMITIPLMLKSTNTMRKLRTEISTGSFQVSS